MASYNPNDPTIQAYLASGGTQDKVDAYFAAAPGAAQQASDSSQWWVDTMSNPPPAPTPASTGLASLGTRGSLSGALASGPAYTGGSTTHSGTDLQSGKGEAPNTGYYAPGSGTMGDPWEEEPFTWAGARPAQGSMGGAPTAQQGAPAAPLDYSALGTTGAAGGAPMASMASSYSLPGAPAASQALRDLQMGATSGLQGLMARDTTAQRKAIEDALYAGQEESINTAADRSRQAMLEGTFGRGVGSSSILVELAGRGEQERADALSRARREAFTQAGSEDRADLASALGLQSAGFNAATTGLQGEANVALANLAREQQESQFSRNLGFQGSENAANRAQSASQFGQNLGLQQQQLGQQASQFGQNLAFQGDQNAANRAMTVQEAELNRQLQQLILQSQQTFAGGQNQAARDAAAAAQASSQTFAGQQNQLTRDQQLALQQGSQTFTGQQNQLTRDQQLALQQGSQTFTAQQNQAAIDAQIAQLASSQAFAGGQNQLSRDQQLALQQGSQTFTGQQNQAAIDAQVAQLASQQAFAGGQNQLTRDQQNNNLLLQLAQQEEIANQNRIAAGIGAAGAGAGSLLGPWLSQYIKGLG